MLAHEELTQSERRVNAAVRTSRIGAELTRNKRGRGALVESDATTCSRESKRKDSHIKSARPTLLFLSHVASETLYHRSSAQETPMQRSRHRIIRSAKQRPINSHSTGFLPVTDPWVVHYWLLYGTFPYLYRARCSSELGKTRICLRHESK
jgi:hypothetical protein